MAEIKNLAVKGRAAKAFNLWNSKWRDGIESLMDAYELISVLYQEIEGFWHIYEEIRRREREDHERWLTRRLALAGYVVGALGLLWGITVWVLR
jgi:septation ring formation regulator EzrA